MEISSFGLFQLSFEQLNREKLQPAKARLKLYLI